MSKNFKHLLFFAMACLCSCRSSKNPSIAKAQEFDSAISTDQSELQSEEEDGPPFSDSCLCTFARIAEIKSSDKRLDLIISGKGWNPSYTSCTWAWGELIENESPSDSTITDFRVQLVDLDRMDGQLDSSFLSSTEFNDHLIATSSRADHQEYRECIFDPNKTGKYPKPKQWVE